MLMETLNGTTPHYVRCIKPNDDKQPFEYATHTRHTVTLSTLHSQDTVTLSMLHSPDTQSFWVRYTHHTQYATLTRHTVTLSTLHSPDTQSLWVHYTHQTQYTTITRHTVKTRLPSLDTKSIIFRSWKEVNPLCSSLFFLFSLLSLLSLLPPLSLYPSLLSLSIPLLSLSLNSLSSFRVSLLSLLSLLVLSGMTPSVWFSNYEPVVFWRLSTSVPRATHPGETIHISTGEIRTANHSFSP